MAEERILTHFTDSAGLAGITGLDPDSLVVGQEVVIETIRFGAGLSSFFAGNAGDIFVTELSPTAAAGQLMLIGVFGSKQQFAISFTAEAALNSGVRVAEGRADRNIFVVPAHSVISGTIRVIRRF